MAGKVGGMIRPATLIWIGLVVVIAVVLFLVKYEVKSLDDELAALQQDALAQQEAIHVLRAEWSYLNRPERLAELAERHLDLEPVGPGQLVAFDPWLESAPNQTDVGLGQKISSGRTEP
jgi:cell division protein FtsL